MCAVKRAALDLPAIHISISRSFMSLNEQTLTAALQTVIDPNTGKDFVTTKALKNLQINGGDVSFDVVLGNPA